MDFSSLENKKRWQRLMEKMRTKYRLVIMNHDTYEQKISIRLTRWNVFIILGAISIILIFVTSYLIAFTPLREYIPGYASVNLSREVYELQLRSDSIEREIEARDLMLNNIRSLFTGTPIVTGLKDSAQATAVSYKDIKDSRSSEDSALRKLVEQSDKFSLRPMATTPNGSLATLSLFSPVKGVVVAKFNAATGHYGIDIATAKNESVKAARDGSVIFAGWSVEAGYVIIIQHTVNQLTVYKHNSALLKKQGDLVKAGDPVAIVGNSGEYTTGPHLHFELWNNGAPVDPEQFIQF